VEGGSAQASSGGKQVRRSTLAVAAGFVLALFLSRSVDVLLERTGVFPTVAQQQAEGFDVLWMNVVALCYRMAFGVLGGYVTAAIAPNRPARRRAGGAAPPRINGGCGCCTGLGAMFDAGIV